jgi:hypothetical protein
MFNKIIAARGKGFQVGDFKTFWGIDPKLSQSYINDGFLRPEKYSTGSGTYHVFGVRETIKAGLLFSLVQHCGMSRSAASQMAYSIDDHDIQRMCEKEIRYLCWFTGTDGAISPPLLREEYQLDFDDFENDQLFLGVLDCQKVIATFEKAL